MRCTPFLIASVAYSVYWNALLWYRVDPRAWEKSGIRVVTWTVNNRFQKNHFKYTMKIPYMTDEVGMDVSAPEQNS